MKNNAWFNDHTPAILYICIHVEECKEYGHLSGSMNTCSHGNPHESIDECSSDRRYCHIPAANRGWTKVSVSCHSCGNGLDGEG